MENKPKIGLILSLQKGKSNNNIMTKYNLEKFKLKKIRLDKEGLINNLLLNKNKLNSVKNNNIEYKNIHYVKKKSLSKMTPFQVYQKIKMVKKNNIEYKRNNSNTSSNYEKLLLISRNKTLATQSNSNISLNQIKFRNKKKYSINIKKNKKIKARNFNILNEYNNMTEFTRMIRRDLLKIEKCPIKKSPIGIKFNELKMKLNSIKKIYSDKKSLIYQLKNKYKRFPTINKSLSYTLINKT